MSGFAARNSVSAFAANEEALEEFRWLQVVAHHTQIVHLELNRFQLKSKMRLRVLSGKPGGVTRRQLKKFNSGTHFLARAKRSLTIKCNNTNFDFVETKCRPLFQDPIVDTLRRAWPATPLCRWFVLLASLAFQLAFQKQMPKYDNCH